MGEAEDQLLAVQRIVTFAAQHLDSVAPSDRAGDAARHRSSPSDRAHHRRVGHGCRSYHGLEISPEQFEEKLMEELGLMAFDNARRKVIAALRDPMDEITG